MLHWQIFACNKVRSIFNIFYQVLFALALFKMNLFSRKLLIGLTFIYFLSFIVYADDKSSDDGEDDDDDADMLPEGQHIRKDTSPPQEELDKEGCALLKKIGGDLNDNPECNENA